MRNTGTIGYAFLLPPDAEPRQNPVSLHRLLRHVRNGDDIPSLDKRFRLAKALVSTVFEIHSLGLLHRNILPKNILFWPKSNSRGNIDISKPYLIGFDISRPIQPEESSEQPLLHPDDNLYRHPSYQSGATPHTFQPSFDLYSLGVVLFEIGVWRCAKVASQPATDKYGPEITPPNSEDIIIPEKNGPVGQLKRSVGKKYRDAVLACLKMEFDGIWANPEEDREKLLHTYLDQVQDKVVDAIGVCRA